MKLFIIILLFLYSAMVHAENYRLTKPDAWKATTIVEAIEKLYGTNVTQEDNRIFVTLASLAENRGSIPLRIRTSIPAKSIAVLQDSNPRALVTVFTVHYQPDYSIRLKSRTTATVVILVEGLDGKFYFYSKKVNVYHNAGACGNATRDYYPSKIKSIYTLKAEERAERVKRERTMSLIKSTHNNLMYQKDINTIKALKKQGEAESMRLLKLSELSH